ncbi:hypothetical protein VP01_2455g4 [Puccinia sorghi]|uniref:Uncharacterized protein n=1 Tax=Puccinia sorghi TaxID=27349 RepID=A0A0L6V622_9BASI|nr:hypothetical protein VP01_2455g4 [Puccinia sorghi]
MGFVFIPKIFNTLGYTFSNQSIIQWMHLYEVTQAVICNTDDYEACGSQKPPGNPKQSGVLWQNANGLNKCDSCRQFFCFLKVISSTAVHVTSFV